MSEYIVHTEFGRIVTHSAERAESYSQDYTVTARVR